MASKETRNIMSEIVSEAKLYVAEGYHSAHPDARVTFRSGTFKVSCKDNRISVNNLIARIEKNVKKKFGTVIRLDPSVGRSRIDPANIIPDEIVEEAA